ncbi:hypothetical protein D918_07256 [Trichuris suis]|nr:hypothetical protein D918_07256 [Trichuris suis]
MLLGVIAIFVGIIVWAVRLALPICMPVKHLRIKLHLHPVEEEWELLKNKRGLLRHYKSVSSPIK